MSKIKFMQGNEACVEGAIAAGMKFFAGYPITPSTEVMEKSAEMLPKVEGKFIQMEDEIAGIAAAIGGSIAGSKSMTATSGPGFSLKMENLGYAVIAEIPLVVVNVQRNGPSTGLPTSPSQGDMMQAKWGTHGDHPVIALSPSTVQECYSLTARAFNLAEKYRMPVLFMLDEVVGHMREKVVLDTTLIEEIVDRAKPAKDDASYLPYGVSGDELVPKMSSFGEGHRYHITGLVHDETGFPTNSTKVADKLMTRLMDKVEKNKDDIIQYEEYMMEDAEYVIFSYGSTARSSKQAVMDLREKGIKAGLFRAITIWPFPEDRIRELAQKSKGILVAEMNLGQMVLEVERIANGSCPVKLMGKGNGEFISPAEIVEKFGEVM
ncbi:2-oxoacid:acceptor oxidoreductase subunit alpha [Ilyobacter polytropus]|uniref:2-oxoglutarate ferredoxin oxidoreductase, alpha subunit n=1 Tax=Ilyobacter polytropus (strain ATCC 51220 / DSM 2926 / LMG 16218 / CuHBu1) TaxID=572544 RepID=E3H6J0_ILYPC|nr:2-oxoacid:acceptor oxidoreductase subunit alpha [Ilyobacter polytropus]ADO81875.1 2-oxoglutarate ferredoxin oxidoreductase, alpha subunit [Ilyobacter polytropus DSM 2926]ADO84472.1 2-oxoglutarate ferredoxin oxidoreductase, alpha subunit [Ilyobacter polytropus DSM 2926]